MIVTRKAMYLMFMGELFILLAVLGFACSIDTPVFVPPTAAAGLLPVGNSTILHCVAPPNALAIKPEGSAIYESTPGTETCAYNAPLSTMVVLPPQGLYESCVPTHAGCLDHLTEMSTKGFTIVLNDGLRYVDTANDLRTYADRANELGMKIILPIKYSPDWDHDNSFLVKEFPELAEECNCTDNRSFLTYYINTLKNHPALWGYYMADEIHSEHHDGLKTYSDLVESIDPNHPRLIVEEGTNDPMEIFFTFHSYMNDTTDIVALDNYPYGYIDTYTHITRYTGDSARMIQYWSDKLHLKSAIVLQAFAWTQYEEDTGPLCHPWPACAPFPNYQQMKAQRDQTILNSRPEIILWYYYPDILNSDNPAQHWSDLAAAAFAPLPIPTPSPTPRQQECPSGWNCEDIGSPKLEGTQSLSGSVWSVEGSGWDIWSSIWEKADQFRYVWQELRVGGQFSARITSQTNTNSSAKAGIMLRKTFDPVSPYYAVFVTPRNGIHVQYRSDFNQDPMRLVSASRTPPVYLKIVRVGLILSAYTSTDGTNWTLIPNSTVNIAGLGGSLMAGLAVTSRNQDMLSTANFDSVDISRSNQLYLPILLRESATTSLGAGLPQPGGL